MVKQNKGHWVTPFWHNDAHSRVTVTFGARRGEGGKLKSLVADQPGSKFQPAGEAPAPRWIHGVH